MVLVPWCTYFPFRLADSSIAPLALAKHLACLSICICPFVTFVVVYLQEQRVHLICWLWPSKFIDSIQVFVFVFVFVYSSIYIYICIYVCREFTCTTALALAKQLAAEAGKLLLAAGKTLKRVSIIERENWPQTCPGGLYITSHLGLVSPLHMISWFVIGKVPVFNIFWS